MPTTDVPARLRATPDLLEIVDRRSDRWPAIARRALAAARADDAPATVAVLAVEVRRPRFRRAAPTTPGVESVVRALRPVLPRQEALVMLEDGAVAVLFAGRGLDDAFSRIDALRALLGRDVVLSATVAAVRDGEELGETTERARLKLARFPGRGASALAV